MYLLELYNEWFSHPNWWFNATPEDDIYLTNKYEKYINDPLYFNFNQIKDIIGYIILHDQIPRHINRVTKDIDINKHLLYALKASKFIINNNLINILTIEELCFVLLPLRHNNDIFEATGIMWKYLEEINKINNSLIKRFMTASYDKINTKNQLEFIIKSAKEKREDQFPESYNSVNLDLINESAYLSIENLIYTKKPTDLILSLSMGVDSAICTLILSALRYKYKFNLHAIHINYCNRKETNKEQEFIEGWCNYLKIPCYIRAINEIKRDSCMKYNLRELYETYTKNVRMNTYKNVWNNILKLPGNPIILLGHNKNDCFENILTNITQQQKYNNLQGMKVIENNEDIIFWRPLLNISKEEIKQFAKNYNIPHLPNSTPSWSQRGKIRDKVRPVLEEWDPHCIDSFYKLSDTLGELNDIVNDTIDLIILSKMTKLKLDDKNVYLINNPISTNTIFWTQLFMKLFGNKISHKSINSMIIRIKNKNNLSNIILSKKISINLSNRNNIIINEHRD
jgi:tRNA(Ile)-lysidine synthetase-like protein